MHLHYFQLGSLGLFQKGFTPPNFTSGMTSGLALPRPLSCLENSTTEAISLLDGDILGVWYLDVAANSL
jgi:hypothetical protein